MKIVESPEESGLLMKGVSETNKNETKSKKWISQYVIRDRCYFISKSISM